MQTAKRASPKTAQSFIQRGRAKVGALLPLPHMLRNRAIMQVFYRCGWEMRNCATLPRMTLRLTARKMALRVSQQNRDRFVPLDADHRMVTEWEAIRPESDWYFSH